MASNGGKQEQIQALLKQAEDGIKAVLESDTYKQYLSTMSKFHSYSYRNIMLILAQNPAASYVAGYKAWNQKFNRQVQSGEKGIQIIGYSPKNIIVDKAKTDQDGNTVTDQAGKTVLEKVTRQVASYFPVYVYDIAQTKGDPLPKLVNELDGSVTGYNELMQALKESTAFSIELDEIPGDTKGICNYSNKQIIIQSGMSEAQTIKTAIHEITHADLHAPKLALTMDTDIPYKHAREVEAESTAFVVCSHYGLDTSEYSFPYLASWSSTAELKELESSLERIQKESSDLITRIDGRLQELQKEHNIDNLRRSEETLNSVKHDNDIDQDRERTRGQLGFSEDRAPAEPVNANIAERIENAKEKAAQREADRQSDTHDKDHQKKPDKELER